jgi:hypothetical protein
VLEDVTARVMALSSEKLALLNLRVGAGGPAPVSADTRGRPPAAAIPRLERRRVGDIGVELDHMSSGEIDRLLQEVRGDEQRALASRVAETSSSGVIPRVARGHDARPDARLDELSDAQVDAMLRDLLPEVDAGSA